MQEAEEGANRGALPRAVWTEEAEELTLFDLEVERGERLDLASAAVVLREGTGLNGE